MWLLGYSPIVRNSSYNIRLIIDIIASFIVEVIGKFEHICVLKGVLHGMGPIEKYFG